MSNIDLTLHGGIGLGLDNIQINYLAPIEIKPIDIKIEPLKVDLGLDNMGLTLGVRPTRVHFPINYHMCFSLFGKEIMKLGMCGESMVIIEPYSPHQTETCR